MYIESIIEEARDLLGDTKVPYLWSEKEMLRYYKNVANQFCRETFIYKDESTASVCYIYLLPGVHTYDLSDLVLSIDSAHLYANKSPVYPISQRILEETSYDWRSTTGIPYRYLPYVESQKIRVYPYYSTATVEPIEGAGSVVFAVTVNTITVPGVELLISGFDIGDQIVISGTSLNNGLFTISDIHDTYFTVSENLVDETNSNVDIRVVLETMIMNVARLPDHSLLTVSTWDTTSPPFNVKWHSKLVAGIMAEAYNKRDSETYDPKEREICRTDWKDIISDAKADVILISDDCERFNPNPGAI